MSIQVVQTAILRQIQQNTDIDSEFGIALTGTVSSDDTIVTGVNTLFDTELKVDDYIGNIINGYRRIKSISGATSLEIEESFLSDLASEAIKKINIKPGLPKVLNLTELGKMMFIAFVSSADDYTEIQNETIDVIYGFLIAMGFIEPNEIDAEVRKSGYEKVLKDAIYKDSTFGGVCFDDTTIGKVTFIEAPDSEGYYYGVMPLVVKKNEDADDR